MGFTGQGKLTLTAGLIFLLLNVAALGPIATSAVPDAVQDAVATKPLDDACTDKYCEELNDDWLSSTSPRDFYAYHISNIDDVLENGSDPTYELIGPVTYDVTTDRELVSHDPNDGLLTYRSYTTYECAEDSAVSCDTEISNLNIAFTPQIVGATGTAVAGVMDITKIGFASGVIDIHFQQVAAAHQVTNYIHGNLQNLSAVEGFIILAPDNARSYFLDGMFDLFDGVYGENFLDENISYLDSGGVHPQWNDTTLDLTSTFWNTTGPSGENLSLMNYMGPLVYAAMGEPDSMEEIIADPENSVTMMRAETWGFTHPTDLNITLARDWTMYGGMGKLMMDYGALDDNYLNNDSEDAINLTQRFRWMLDVEIDQETARDLLTRGHGGDDPLGILAVSESGTSFGLSAFLEMDKKTAKETFGLDDEQWSAVHSFCGAWATDATSLPLILVGGSGYMTASEFVNQTFGSVNPIDGTYTEYSLNVGGMWGTGLFGFPAGDAVDLTQAQSANMLYADGIGLATSEGAAMFLYGELSGKTLPINITTGEPAQEGVWDNATVAEIYGIDENAAGAARLLMMEVVFKNFVPEFLIDTFGTSPYLTQSINNWLLGWHDPVSAYLATGDPTNMSDGWTSLETNRTYFGSGGKVNDMGTVYTICTGESNSCDKGETMLVDGSEYFAWKDPAKENATYGLITAEKRSGTTGGFLTGDGDIIDLSGYGTAPVVCSKEDTLKGIPVDVCTASMDPLTRPIQAKLVNNGDLLDATPGALPVYFGSDVEVKAEKLSGAIIAGKSESTFYLDTRPIWEQQTPPTMDDMQKVFVIKTGGELDDETAESMESQIVTNQETLGYWTNFDHPVDYITLILYVLGLICTIAGAAMVFKDSTEDDEVGVWKEPEVDFSVSDEEQEKSDEIAESDGDEETSE